MSADPTGSAHGRLVVAHSLEVWLPPTMTWAYNQLKYAEGTEALVLATATRNLDRFPWRPLYVSNGRVETWTVRAGRRAGLRMVPAAFGRAFREHHPAVLHSHFGYRGWTDLPLVRRYRPAHVVTFYGHDVTMYPRTWPVWRRRYEELFAAADLILCEGPFMADSIVELGCPESKVRVQRLGVELDRLPCRPRSLAPGEPVRVLVAGAFRPKKGIPSALEAVAAARAGGLDLRVTVVGGSNGSPGEEDERRRIEEVVRRRSLADIVTFAGMIPYDRLINAVESHHLLLSPSITAPDGDSEGGAPVTIIEAAASGMPVVSTTHCDIPQVVADGRTGLLAPEGDQEALADCLARLAGDPVRWPGMGAAAGELTRRSFDVRVCAAQLVDAYREAARLASARRGLP
jgi:colanic acid/amylovoran biosynthesis glycosyltransferase